MGQILIGFGLMWDSVSFMDESTISVFTHKKGNIYDTK